MNIKEISELKTENIEMKEQIKSFLNMNERLCNKIESLERKLEEINLLAQSLYYHSITDPVKRAEAIDEIIILAGGR